MGIGLRGGNQACALLRPRGGELSFDYELRRSDRARNIRITVSERGVIVVVPRRAAQREAHAFVQERREWVERALARLADHRATVAARGLADGDTVPYLGDELRLRVIDGASERVVRAGGAGELRVHTADGSREHVAELLERWYRRRAREEVRRRLDAAVARNGTSYLRLAIRDQRTRWGSCSSSGTLSFNWRLLLAPGHVLDYVVEHEAAHIEVPDHSPRFWSLMDLRVPNWKVSRDWLRRHGGTLHLV